MRTSTSDRIRLKIDPVACQGIGMCAHLAPDLVELDKWGYPILLERNAAEHDPRGVATAVAACPRRALFAE